MWNGRNMNADNGFFPMVFWMVYQNPVVPVKRSTIAVFLAVEKPPS
jgi:hypothetical protein